jgi:glucose/arabinose dehydrogenase
MFLRRMFLIRMFSIPRTHLYLILLLPLIFGKAMADTSPNPNVMAEGLIQPWGMAQVSDTHLLITQKGGSLVLFDMDSKVKTSVRGAPKVAVMGQGGLLDVAVPPDYKKGDSDLGWIYFTYVALVNNDLGATALGRAKLNESLTALKEWQTLLITKSASDEGRHFGSRLAFMGDYVFFGVGDRGNRDNGQDLSTHAGSILRLHRDGRVPEDNPFVDQKRALPEIWSYGHRNPQGLAVRNGQLWESEHGPRGGDELNKIEKGANYGWPEVSLGKEYWGPLSVGEESKPGMIDPVKAYIPSIAPSSLIAVKSNRYGWAGDFLSGALKLQHLNRLVMRGDQVMEEKRYFEDQGERIRDVLEDSKGRVWVITDSGKLQQLP